MSHPFRAVNIRWCILAVCALSFAVFMAGLNRVPVPTVDGAVRASMARNIVEGHQLWPIVYEDRVFTDHPPLFLWLTALSYKILGINDFAANLVPRLFAFLTVVVTAMIALETGMSAGVALASVVILCATRDFVLSSVRGYLEPVLEFFIYFAFWLVLRQRSRSSLWSAAGAGLSVWLAAYTKGPVALWPLIAFLALLSWEGRSTRKRVHLANAYMGTFVGCCVLWAIWVTSRGDWKYWQSYLFGQVLSSALEGRGGAQSLEPFYFVKILLRYYWPWLPLLLGAFYHTARRISERMLDSQSWHSFLFGIFGLGFVGAFSLMKWKFWYYIAPAYPAFALLIATGLQDYYVDWAERKPVARGVLLLAVIWILITTVYPVELHRDRVPEVHAFKETIVNSPVTGPVWFVRDPADHNMVGTSGQWYFNRRVIKITEGEESDWLKNRLKAPAWIITGADYWRDCRESWCRGSRLIQSAGKSALVYFGQ